MKKTLRGIIALILILVVVLTTAFFVIKYQKDKAEPETNKEIQGEDLGEISVEEKPVQLSYYEQIVSAYTGSKDGIRNFDKLLYLQENNFFENDLKNVQEFLLTSPNISNIFNYASEEDILKLAKVFKLDDKFFVEYSQTEDYEKYFSACRNHIYGFFYSYLEDDVLTIDEKYENAKKFVEVFLAHDKNFSLDKYLFNDILLGRLENGVISDSFELSEFLLKNNSIEYYFDSVEELNQAKDKVLSYYIENIFSPNYSYYLEYRVFNRFGEVDDLDKYLEYDKMMAGVFSKEMIDYNVLLKEALDHAFLDIALNILENNDIDEEYLKSEELQNAFYNGLADLFRSNDIDEEGFNQLKSYLLVDEETYKRRTVLLYENILASVEKSIKEGVFISTHSVYLPTAKKDILDVLEVLLDNAEYFLGDDYLSTNQKNRAIDLFDNVLNLDFWENGSHAYILLNISNNLFESPEDLPIEQLDKLKNKFSHMISADGGGMENDSLMKELLALKDVLKIYISDEEMEDLIFDGIYSRLSKNYLSDTMYIINNFFPENVKFEQSYYSSRPQGVSTFNMDYRDDVKDLALEKFGLFVANGWIRDSVYIRNYYLLGEESKVKEIISDNYYDFLENDRLIDLQDLNSEYSSLMGKEFFSAYTEMNWINSPVMKKVVVKEVKDENDEVVEKVIEKIENVFTEAEIDSYYEANKKYGSYQMTRVVNMIKTIIDEDLQKELAKKYYLGCFTEKTPQQYLAANLFLDNFDLSFDDFVKTDLLEAVNGIDLSAAYINADNRYDSLIELLEYLDQGLDLSSEALLKEAKKCFVHDVDSYYYSGEEDLICVKNLKEKYSEILTDEVILADEELIDNLLSALKAVIVFENQNGYKYSIIYVSVPFSFYEPVDTTDTSLVYPESFAYFYDFILENDIDVSILEDAFLEWESLYLAGQISNECMGGCSTSLAGNIIEKFEDRFLAEADEAKLKEAKLNGLKLLFNRGSYYGGVEERAQEISDKFGVSFIFDDYQLFLEKLLKESIEKNSYESIVSYIMMFDNDSHDLLNYVKTELAK